MGIKMEVWNQFKKASVWVRVSVYRRYGCHDFKVNNGSWSAYFPTTCWFIFFFLPNQSSIKVAIPKACIDQQTLLLANAAGHVVYSNIWNFRVDFYLVSII